MTEVMRISKPGKDALTETDPNSFILLSELPTYKISAEGSQQDTIAIGNYEHTWTIPHGLGYTPMFMAWIEHSGRSYQCSQMTNISDIYFTTPHNAGNQITVSIYAWADNTNIYIQMFHQFPVDAPNDTAYMAKAHWKIFIDEF